MKKELKIMAWFAGAVILGTIIAIESVVEIWGAIPYAIFLYFTIKYLRNSEVPRSAIISLSIIMMLVNIVATENWFALTDWVDQIFWGISAYLWYKTPDIFIIDKPAGVK
jgi:hypothetical protein